MNYTQIPGVASIVDDYDTFFIDMCGVLMKPPKMIEGTQECLHGLKAANKKLAMVTNAEETSRYLTKILKMEYGFRDVDTLFDAIVTAGDMVQFSLREWGLRDGARAFLWGEFPMLDVMSFFQRVETYYEADVVVCCEAIPMDSTDGAHVPATHQKMLEYMLANNIPLLSPNSDVVAPIADGTLYLVAGFFAKKYAEMGGRSLTTGKPGENIFARAHALLGYPSKQRILMVGDTIETDILGAHNFGIDSLLVKSGNYGNKSHLVTHDIPLEVHPNWLVDTFVL